MGKKCFKYLYRRIKREFGTVICKTSLFCDEFYSSCNYAGAIIYAIDGQFEWINQDGGKADGYSGKSLYIIIQCTDCWPPDALKEAGQGRVHDYLLKNVLGIDYEQDRLACSGFSYLDGQLKFSSVWLNARDQIGAESDGSKYLSDAEALLVIFCFNEYKRHGANHTFKVSSSIDKELSKIESSTYLIN